MGKQVKVYTTAHNPDTGESKTLAPGDEVPSGFKVGDHVYDEADGGTQTDVVAGPGQAALTRAQLKELERQLDEQDKESGAEATAQTRTSGSSNAQAGKGKS